MTKEKLNQQGYIVLFQEREIKPITYKDYLCYFDDENKLFIVENEESGFFEIWIKEVNRPAKKTNNFDCETEEDAELEIFAAIERYIFNKNWNVPIFLDTYKDAIIEMAEHLERSTDVIERYLKLQKITSRKDVEHRAKITAEYEARKQWLQIEVPKEAESIVIDELFKSDVLAANKLSGKDKNKAHTVACAALLNRLGGISIKTDFWQVMRILINKVK